jgi:hypothetical protein
MSLSLLAVVTALYLGVTISLAWEGHMPMALVFGGYTIGNIGLIWSMK